MAHRRETIMPTFKKRLEYYMLREGLRPSSLSKKAGLNITAVRDILTHKGSPAPRISTFVSLCKALNVYPHQLHPGVAKLYTSRQRRCLDADKKKETA